MTQITRALSRRQLLRGAAAGAATLALRPAFAANPIKIGFGMSLTGPNAGAGNVMKLGLELWRDDVNAKGGLLGRPVEFVAYDDQSNPSLVPALYTKLLDVDNVDLVISGFGTNQIAPAMPVVMQRQKVFMALFGTGVNDEFQYDRYFQILPNGPEGNRGLSLGFFETALAMEPKPRRVALLGEDTEFGHNILAGARANIATLGLEIVHDRSFPPSTVDHSPLIRAAQAAQPDIVFVASYPTGSAGMVRALSEVGYRPRMFGGAMIGLQFAAIKAQLGPLLNDIVINENFVPEPTMNFPGVAELLERYRQRAAGKGIDPLGFWSPFAYAEMQILAEAITATGGLDQAAIAAYIRKTKFATVVGEVKFGAGGEWQTSRILFIQYRNVEGHDVDQFRRPGKQVILYPPALRSGPFVYPFAKNRAP
jgi:branched-chain amino acid transport system substrate-binding protein